MGRSAIFRHLLFLIVTVFLCLAVSCWDQREVERLGLVMAIGVEQETDGKLRVTLQQLLPQPGKGGNGGRTASLTAARSYLNLTATGTTIFEAVRELARQSQRQLFYAHNQVILIGEELARERGLADIIDFFERNPQLRRTSWLIVVRGKIEDVLSREAGADAIPAQQIVNILRERDFSGRYAPKKVNEFVELLEQKGAEPFTAVLALFPGESSSSPRPEFVFVETAIFKDYRMVGTMNGIETRGLLWLRGELRGGVFSIRLDEPVSRGGESKSKGVAAVEIVRARAKIQPAFTAEGNLKINATFECLGKIDEVMGFLDLSQPDVVHALEKAAAEVIKEEVAAALHKGQKELKADVFGFGEVVRRWDKNYWREHRDEWDAIFPDLPVEVNVNFKIRYTGLVSQPLPVKRPDRK